MDYESSDDESLDNGNIGESMKNLASKDPDFYRYLMKNEKSLLEFADEDDDEDDEDDDDDYNEDSQEKKKRIKVTDEMLANLADEIASKPNRSNIQKLVGIFDEALVQSAGVEGENEPRYKISPDLFNDICELCYLSLTPGLYQMLGLKLPGQSVSDKLPDPSKCKNWKIIRITLRKYLILMVKALDTITDELALCALLRHALNMAPFIRCFPAVIKRYLKVIIKYWSESTEKVRVLCFLCIVRLVRSQSSDLTNIVMKKLYMSYVQHSNSYTSNNVTLVRFMQQSLIELYSLDHEIAYNHAFLYVKQCAVLLRSAIIGGKKGNIKSVYNWPFVHSIILWIKLIGALNSTEIIKSLINPVVQVAIGTIKLAPVAQHFPLRFHLLSTLIEFSAATGTFIPLSPLITNCLDQVDYSKKASVDKQLDMTCLLKISKAHLYGPEFRNAIVKSVHQLLLEYLATQSHSIGFPELAFIPLTRVKRFLKEKCRNSEHGKLLKQACEKIEENIKFIEDKRSKIDFKFTDIDATITWQKDLQSQASPIACFIEKWKSIKEKQHKEKAINEQNAKLKETNLKGKSINDKKQGKRKNFSTKKPMNGKKNPVKFGKRKRDNVGPRKAKKPRKV